jgi:tRNA(Arg) A34 adenosine deaminase TadA
MKARDQAYIQRTIALAGKARQRGNHPFAAILVGPENEILLEAENTVVTEKDITAHAETNLIRSASQTYPPEFLASCTLYASTEPCPMCAGAIFWSNVRRVVYGLSESRLYAIIGEETTDEVLKLGCREVFERGQRPIEVVGPLLEEEAEKVHLGFWTQG